MKDIVKLSVGEETANAITHGVMSLLTLIALPIVSIYTFNIGGTLYAFSASVYLLCIFFMFTVSTLYHIMPYDTKYKYIFRILDHTFIYFAIAGTYTPIALCLIEGWQGYTIIFIQWSMVLFGILYKALSKKSMPKVSLAIYLIMGWTAVLFLPALIAKASVMFLTFILLGGVFYSIGAYFYAKKSIKYSHVIWHFFINFASICHFIAVIFLMFN